MYADFKDLVIIPFLRVTTFIEYREDTHRQIKIPFFTQNTVNSVVFKKI